MKRPGTGTRMKRCRPDLRGTFSTCALGERLAPFVECGEHGLRTMVDVGAGGSNLAQVMRARGVDAVAVDPRYDRSFIELRNSVRGKSEFDAKDIDPSNVRQKVRAFLQRNFGNEDQYAFEMMLHDAGQNPDKYQKAFADRLPFEDGVIDTVFSMSAVSAFLMEDVKFAKVAVREMLRIACPGGVVQIAPWPNGERMGVKWPERHERTAAVLLEGLKGEVGSVRVEEFWAGSNQLIIRK